MVRQWDQSSNLEQHIAWLGHVDSSLGHEAVHWIFFFPGTASPPTRKHVEVAWHLLGLRRVAQLRSFSVLLRLYLFRIEGRSNTAEACFCPASSTRVGVSCIGRNPYLKSI
jgi:hypothetical protein